MEEHLDRFMKLAIDEARLSLREGNCGFGAVIIRDCEVVCSTHDREKTQGDSTEHAEMRAIRGASKVLGRDLSACTIVCTHEPCPMCATAILWSGISSIAYGFSIKEAIQQGRMRIDFPCREIFDRAGKPVAISTGFLHDQCAMLYDSRVRDCIDELRDADEERLIALGLRLSKKRVEWFRRHQSDFMHQDTNVLDRAYKLFLCKLSICAEEAPIVDRAARRIVIRSQNFCPTLAACEILGLDTASVCSRATERPMDELLKQLDPRLVFSRNYEAIRPRTDYCEEIIWLSDSNPI